MKPAWMLAIVLTVASQAREVCLLHIGYYAKRCPAAEVIVGKLVRLGARRDPTLPPALLRLHYHDCFVGVLGCDASILLDAARGYPPPEKIAPPNISLRGFPLIDTIKRVLEAVCPLTVSCADILALSARESVVITGGPRWEVPTGRRDSRLSSAVLAKISLPHPQYTATQIKQNFIWHGLSESEMITLSGAHTIGFARCATVRDRLYNYNSTLRTDPSMNSFYAARLKKICRKRIWNSKMILPLDPVTPFKFDNMYYKNLDKGLALLTSDQVIHENRTFELSSNSTLWEHKFREAMVHLGSLKVITGLRGEIRRNCRRRN